MRPQSAFVWTGRKPGAWPGGRDAWTTPRLELIALLKAADVLVLVDPVSFHYPMLANRRNIPFVVVLPDDHESEHLEGLLGEPLLSWMGPADRIIATRPGQRELLGDYDLPDEVWVDGTGGWQQALEAHLADAETIERLVVEKARLQQRYSMAEKQVHDGLVSYDRDDQPIGMPRRVALLGETRHWHLRLARTLRAEVYGADMVDRPGPDGFPRVSPGAALVAFRDGGQTTEERLTMLATAHDVLSPGGALVVLAHVVDTEDGRPNPSIGQLVEEVHEATGHLVHLEEMQSVRWTGDRMTRGVVLRFTSLRQREM